MRIGGYLWVEMNKARIWDVTQFLTILILSGKLI